MSEGEKSRTPRRLRRAGRTGILAILSLGISWLVGILLLMTLLERPAVAPDWLRNRIAAQLGEALPGLSLRFDGMSVLLRRNGQLDIDLRDVALTGPGGSTVGAMSDLTVGLRPLALLQQGGGLREMAVSGVFLTIRRAPDGKIGLDLGDMFAGDGRMPGVPDVVAMIDKALASPRLAGLRRISADAVTLRYEDARAHRGWTIDGGRVELLRDREMLSLRGDFAVLGGGAGVATMAVSAESRLGDNGLSFGIQMTDMPSADLATQGPALAWFDALRAPISGAMRAQMFPDGTLGPLNATFQIGKGVLQPTDKTKPVPFESARTYFTYAPQSATLRFDEVSVVSGWGSVTARGRADLLDIKGGLPGQMVAQFEIADILANPEDVFTKPVTLARAEMDLRLRLNPFELTLGRMRVDDAKLPLRLTGRLAAVEDGWDLAVDGMLDQATPAQIASLWPPRVLEKPRAWFVENIRAGHLSNGQFGLRVQPGQKPTSYASFAVSGATVRYSKSLPPLTEAAGQVTILKNRLVALLDAGRVTPAQGGPIDVAGSSFVIPDLRIKRPPARLTLAAGGSLTAALSFIDTEPLNVMQKAGQPVDVAAGTVRVTGTLDLPLKKGLTNADVLYDFAATARDVSTDRLVKGHSLAADELAVTVTPKAVQVTGKGTFDGIPFDGRWRQALGPEPGPGEVLAQVALSDDHARVLGVTLPAGMVRGTGQGTLTLTLPRGAPPRFSLVSDLRGLSASLPAIGWAFGTRQGGKLSVGGTLSSPPQIDTLEIDAGALKGKAQLTLTGAGKFAELRFDDLTIGDWLRAPVTLTAAGRGMALAVRGGRLDMRKAPFGTSDSGGGGGGGSGGLDGPITLALDSLQISNTMSLAGFAGTFDTKGGLSGEFTGLLNGSAPVKGTVVPSRGRSAFRIQSDDAGRVAQAAGVLKNAVGGSMTLLLTPARQAGEFDGAITATNMRLRNAPAIGAILDAISIVGLLDQLQGPGIYFANVEGEFRLTPSQLVLRRFAATGPSMGISLDGFYTLASGALDMQGVVSPIYLVNGIGSVLTRRGEGLVGFNFTLTGTGENPRVGVNPLSVLTPGMFREIFRRRPPQVSQ